MAYVPPCENEEEREKIKKYNEDIQKLWPIEKVLEFVKANPIPNTDEKEVADAIREVALDLGMVYECCSICGKREDLHYFFVEGCFCGEHAAIGEEREGFHKIPCKKCKKMFVDIFEDGECHECEDED